MRVICKGHKTCSAKDCPHAKPHHVNRLYPSSCVNVPDSDCYCSEDNQQIRKKKLKKIFNGN